MIIIIASTTTTPLVSSSLDHHHPFHRIGEESHRQPARNRNKLHDLAHSNNDRSQQELAQSRRDGPNLAGQPKRNQQRKGLLKQTTMTAALKLSNHLLKSSLNNLKSQKSLSSSLLLPHSSQLDHRLSKKQQLLLDGLNYALASGNQILFNRAPVREPAASRTAATLEDEQENTPKKQRQQDKTVLGSINADNKVTPPTIAGADDQQDEEQRLKRKRHKSAEEAEDEIVNEPITTINSQRQAGRKKEAPRARSDSQQATNSSSSSSSSYPNEDTNSVETFKSPKASDGPDDELAARKAQLTERARAKGQLKAAAAKSAAMVLVPSLESIAMRIVSSAASKTIGRSQPTQLAASSSSLSKQPTSYGHSSTSGEAPSKSFLASLSSSLLSAAVQQLMNSSALAGAGSLPSLQSAWPNKLSPILQSLASLTGLNPEDPLSSLASTLSNLPSQASSSFLSSSDLSAASSSIQPTLYNPNGNKPHTSKQYSPTVLGIVNLARYVLCKYS